MGEVVSPDVGRKECFVDSLELLVHDNKENKATAIFTVGFYFFADHHSIL